MTGSDGTVVDVDDDDEDDVVVESSVVVVDRGVVVAGNVSATVVGGAASPPPQAAVNEVIPSSPTIKTLERTGAVRIIKQANLGHVVVRTPDANSGWR